MKYVQQAAVLPGIAEKSKRNIEDVNEYVDNLHGAVITIKRIRSGQPRPYADSVAEVVIFCFQPNVLTTNAPLIWTITRPIAEQLVRAFVGAWSESPKFLESRLNFLTPIRNPCGLDEPKSSDGEERSSAWHVQITHPYCD